MITISVNELIKDLTCNKVYRLLWIDESNIVTYAIDIEDSNALPFLLKVSAKYYTPSNNCRVL
ncbi:hypothetical protein ADM90_20325 [Lysinibacillus macroides]|uniref:Uncharacterized protein n=1 Tax=Lysinibacillus macroides TaxID=33935 RepID=A0A0N0UW73_9BACI|nr:hypothetical protein ADM90_20325 [Lysinibacillus macroides]